MNNTIQRASERHEVAKHTYLAAAEHNERGGEDSYWYHLAEKYRYIALLELAVIAGMATGGFWWVIGR